MPTILIKRGTKKINKVAMNNVLTTWVQKAKNYMFLNKKTKPCPKSWFCIQRLNETNLVDVGFTKQTWTSMWLPPFSAFFEGCKCWKTFISLGTISKIFV